ncbi:T9SS type A sorting domain-containing protein [Candidatus Kryptobacter tengchongensis]|uniref:T9SS type A sorting domain-containing protein n=1 Tax=Kryptobacter tengchongensis TaxID=1643429 RepID=UPI0007083814|nr:T9SS type A sorting domain-containing protein [Candidatus Kryptobacter tengchongensis]CUS84774.1 Por secretion system C-terminal sorting domain-containing protein [Candidatus Kryptobacter tengchongensis]
MLVLFLFQFFQLLFEIEGDDNKIIESVVQNKSNLYIFVSDYTTKKLYLFLYDRNKNNYQTYELADTVDTYTCSVAFDSSQIFLVYHLSKLGRVQSREIQIFYDNLHVVKKVSQYFFVNNVINKTSFSYERFAYGNFIAAIWIIRGLDTVKIKSCDYFFPTLCFKEKENRYVFLSWFKLEDDGMYYLKYMIVEDSLCIDTGSFKFYEEIVSGFYEGDQIYLVLLKDKEKLIAKRINKEKLIELGTIQGDFYGDFIFFNGRIYIIIRDYDSNRTKIYSINDSITFISEIEDVYIGHSYYEKEIVLWSKKKVISFLPATTVERDKEKYKEKEGNFLVKDYLIFTFSSEIEEIKVYNILGQKINNVVVERRGYKIFVDCRSLTSGIYFIVLKNDKKVLKYIKFIKIK